MNDILVIIPAFNESENIAAVAGRLIREHPDLDYVIVNDGSTDRTAEICRENSFSLIDLPVNLGLAGAFQTGMRYAWKHGYPYAVQFDGDGQHRAEYIRPMYRKAEEGYDIVIASRFVTEHKPASFRMLGSNLIEGAIRLTTGVRIKDPTSGMRMYGKKMIEEFANRMNFAPEPDTVSWLVKNGARIAEIQAKMDLRTKGRSYLTPVTAAKYMIRMLMSILVIQNFREETSHDPTVPDSSDCVVRPCRLRGHHADPQGENADRECRLLGPAFGAPDYSRAVSADHLFLYRTVRHAVARKSAVPDRDLSAPDEGVFDERAYFQSGRETENTGAGHCDRTKRQRKGKRE